MCLALPVKVVELGAGETALVDLGGVKKQVSLELLDDVQVGDYVILHVGYALSKLDPEEAERTLKLFAEMEASGATNPEPPRGEPTSPPSSGGGPGGR